MFHIINIVQLVGAMTICNSCQKKKDKPKPSVITSLLSFKYLALNTFPKGPDRVWEEACAQQRCFPFNACRLREQKPTYFLYNEWDTQL